MIKRAVLADSLPEFSAAEELDRKSASSISGTRLRAQREGEVLSEDAVEEAREAEEMAALYARATRRIEVPEELLAQARPAPAARTVRSVPVDVSSFDRAGGPEVSWIPCSERETLPAPDAPSSSPIPLSRLSRPRLLTDDDSLGPLPSTELPRRTITGSAGVGLPSSERTVRRRGVLEVTAFVAKTLLFATLLVGLGALAALLATRGPSAVLHLLHLG